MAIRWNEYQRIREYENFDIFQRRGEGFPSSLSGGIDQIIGARKAPRTVPRM